MWPHHSLPTRQHLSLSGVDMATCPLSDGACAHTTGSLVAKWRRCQHSRTPSLANGAAAALLVANWRLALRQLGRPLPSGACVNVAGFPVCKRHQRQHGRTACCQVAPVSAWLGGTSVDTTVQPIAIAKRRFSLPSGTYVNATAPPRSRVAPVPTRPHPRLPSVADVARC